MRCLHSSETQILPEGSLIRFNCISLILQGEYDIYRRDGMVVLAGQGPSVLGLAECIQERGHHYVVTRGKCRVITLSMLKASKIMDEENLWYGATAILSWYLQLLAARDEQISGVDLYTIVRNKILELNDFDAALRDHINVTGFIHERSYISRSMINQILSDLKKGEYIDIHRGRLKSILKNLPEKY